MRWPSSLSAIALVLVAFPDQVSAQDRAQTSGQAQVVIVESLSASAIADLSFGYLVIDQGEGGTMLVPPGLTAPSTTGNIRQACGKTAGCAPHPARFLVVGEAGRQYDIALPSKVDARGSSKGFLLVVTDLQARSQNQPDALGGGLLDTGGRDFFDVGGTLHLPSGTPSDIYRAVITLTVNYS